MGLALTASFFLALPVGTAAANNAKGDGNFSGIYPWGNGASKCDKQETGTRLEYICRDVRINYVGSYVLIRFPSKNFQAVVSSEDQKHEFRQNANIKIAWTEQTTGIPIVHNRGTFSSIHDATLDGGSVPTSQWDLGLNAGRNTRTENISIVITRK